MIEAALDARRGEGQRVLITFGAWHAYWFKERHALRDDVGLLSLREAIGSEGSSD